MRIGVSLLLVVALVVAAVLAFVAGREHVVTRAAHPQVDGRLTLAGLEGPVDVLRDERGIPHVVAEHETDAWAALGFVHAQDRLAQMLWLVRLARGRTAEILGPEGLPADREARTLDIGGRADAEWAQLDQPTRRVLEAYSLGINARIARVREGLVGVPRVMRALDLPLEDWQPADSLAVLKFCDWALTNSIQASLVLDDLLGEIGGVAARPFFPMVDQSWTPGPARLPLSAARDPIPPALGALRLASGFIGSSVGSSAWVIGGAHTRNGRPLLVADSHLPPKAPAWLYQAQLRGGELDVAGVTVPGIPGFWTGHNRRVAWASTHARAVVTDLFVETLHDSGEDRYHDGRGWRSLQIREERIVVRGGNDELLKVRSTHHGPLWNDLLDRPRDPLSVAWVGSMGRGAETLRALHRMAHADSADELISALSRLTSPAVAVVYADVEGAAGMQVAGWIPKRTLVTDLVPVPGRARWYDWDGRIPFESLPRDRLEAGRGWSIAADNPLGDPDDGRVEWLWRSGVQAGQIDRGIRAAVSEGKLDLLAALKLQVDQTEPRARSLLAAALSLVEEEKLGSEGREVLKLLRGWDGRTVSSSTGAAVYHIFHVQLLRSLFEPYLGTDLLTRYVTLPQVDPGRLVEAIVHHAVLSDELGEGSERQRVAKAVRDALRDAWFQLSYRLGASRSKWRWGRLHPLTFEPFVPVAAGAGIPTFEMGGSGSTVNTADFSPLGPFDVRVASLFRFAVDLAQLDRSLTVLAPGQSEHPGHPYYDDGLQRWREGRSAALTSSVVFVEEAALARLRLEPAM